MRIIVQNSSEAPIYQQIYDQLREAILTGELKENDSLPSIRQLARELKISVITTTRAYTDLEKDGYVMIVQGKGCFVKSINTSIIEESLLSSIESNFVDAIKSAKILKQTDDDLICILKKVWEEMDNEQCNRC